MQWHPTEAPPGLDPGGARSASYSEPAEPIQDETGRIRLSYIKLGILYKCVVSSSSLFHNGDINRGIKGSFS